MIDLTSNFFQVFDLPEQYQIDLDKLKKQYRELQKQCHPDRFVGQSSQQNRIAEQYTVFINQAYTTLLSPLQRAQYLLSLQEINSNFDTVTHQDNAFLMEQMEFQEALSEINHQESTEASEHLDALSDSINQRYKQLQQEFIGLFDKKDYQQAKETVAKMFFFNKLQQQAQQLEEDMDLL